MSAKNTFKITVGHPTKSHLIDIWDNMWIDPANDGWYTPSPRIQKLGKSTDKDKK